MGNSKFNLKSKNIPFDKCDRCGNSNKRLLDFFHRVWKDGLTGKYEDQYLCLECGNIISVHGEGAFVENEDLTENCMPRTAVLNGIASK